MKSNEILIIAVVAVIGALAFDYIFVVNGASLWYLAPVPALFLAVTAATKILGRGRRKKDELDLRIEGYKNWNVNDPKK